MKESFADRMKQAMDIKDMKQADLVKLTGLTKSAISQYYSGTYEPKQKGIYAIAKALNVSEAWLMGHDVPMERTSIKYPDNVFKIETKKFPMLGTIAAGQPIIAEEQHEYYVEAGSHIHADFCLKIKGDSMINARILDGDTVFIKKQDIVNDGEIAAVLIGDEATLKRVYKTDHKIVLAAENPNYKPLVYENEQLNEIRILGKAVAFQSFIQDNSRLFKMSVQD
jgi:repressor LexA